MNQRKNQLLNLVEKPNRVDKTIKESFMNSYAISPVPASNVPGSDFAGRWCTFEWEEDFPLHWRVCLQRDGR